MPMIEVDEAELQTNRKLRETLNAIAAHPEGRKLMEQAHKMVDPKAPTPTLDAEAPITARVTPLEKRLDEIAKQLSDDKAEREQNAKLSATEKKINEGFDRLRREGLTAAGEEEIKKIMEAEGILNPEIAFAHFERLHPPQAPIASNGSGGWNFMEAEVDPNDDIKKLIETKGESTPVLDKMARDALTEFRGQRR